MCSYARCLEDEQDKNPVPNELPIWSHGLGRIDHMSPREVGHCTVGFQRGS